MRNRLAAELAEGWKIEGMDVEAGVAEGAYKANYAPREFVPATVPMVAQEALLRAGKVADPYVGTNSVDLEWTEGKEWWYFKDFPTPTREAGQRVLLRFEGITYRADVWLNGVQLGKIVGMFRTDTFDVTDHLNADGDNRLTLRVRAMENSDRRDAKGKYRGVRSHGPVAQSMYQWNWSPRLVCVGIWRPVKLFLRGDVFMESAHVRTKKVVAAGGKSFPTPERGNAKIELEWTVRNAGNAAKSIRLYYRVDGKNGGEEKVAEGEVRVALKPGETRVVRKTVALTDVRLWWPNGLGEAFLHALTTEARDEDGAFQRERVVFGVREIKLLHNADELWVTQTTGHTMRPWSNVGRPYPWTFTVNGRPLFLKGSNWVMLDSLLRLEEWRYRRQLDLAKRGGLNFMRVWGGSLAETEAFYDVCDELGILCWQEFWLACANYPAMDQDAFIRCAEDTVRRLISRTSLVYYSGGNEYEPDNRENKGLVDKLAETVRRVDPSREFRRGSPYKGDKHGGLVPTPLMTRNKYLDILPGEKRIVLFRSEVATGRSLPVMSSLEKMFPPESRWPIDEPLWRHFFAVPAEFKMFANSYDALDDFDKAVHANHLAHSNLARYNMEYCRSRMYRCSGNLNWQFNVPWPCAHREVVDTWGVPKPVYYYYVNASRPTILTVDLEKYLWDPNETLNPKVFLANDVGRLDNLRAEVRVIAVSGETLYKKTFAADAPENAAVELGALDYKLPLSLAEKTLFIRTFLLDAAGNRVHENLYWIAVSNHAVADDALSLDGPWRRADGSEVVLPGNDMAIKNASFENIFLKKEDVYKDLENSSNGGSEPIGSATAARPRYAKTFRVPERLKGRDLEFYCAGIESGDIAWVNGVQIGTHEMRFPTLDLDAWAFVPPGEEKPSSTPDPNVESPFYSDPIVLPRLAPRFYDIPAAALKDGDNEIVIELKIAYQKAFSNSMEIRPKTANRAAVAAFMKKGVLFGDARRMPEPKIDVTVFADRVEVKTAGPAPAVNVIIEVVPEADDVAIPLDNNALFLEAGESAVLRAMDARAFAFPAKVLVHGWNLKRQTFRLEKGN